MSEKNNNQIILKLTVEYCRNLKQQFYNELNPYVEIYFLNQKYTT